MTGNSNSETPAGEERGIPNSDVVFSLGMSAVR